VIKTLSWSNDKTIAKSKCTEAASLKLLENCDFGRLANLLCICESNVTVKTAAVRGQ